MGERTAYDVFFTKLFDDEEPTMPTTEEIIARVDALQDRIDKDKQAARDRNKICLAAWTQRRRTEVAHRAERRHTT